MARNNPHISLGWLKELLLRPEDMESSMCLPPTDRTVFDTEQLETCCLGSAIKARRILEAVMVEGPRLVAAIRDSHQDGDIVSLLDDVRDFRALAQVLGAYSCAQICLRLELTYEGSAVEKRRHLLLSLENQTTPLFDAVRLYLCALAA